MFILASKPSTLWPVTYRTPNDDGGFDEHNFKVRFNLPRDQAEVEDILRKVEDARKRFLADLLNGRSIATAEQEEKALELGAVDRWILDTYWAGWPDGEINDLSGAVIPFTEENRAKLQALPGMRPALVRAFMQTFGGNAEAKNSKPLPKNG